MNAAFIIITIPLHAQKLNAESHDLENVAGKIVKKNSRL